MISQFAAHAEANRIIRRYLMVDDRWEHPCLPLSGADRCYHVRRIPVTPALLGAPVAELCLTCDEQLPLPWPEDIQ